MLLQDLKFQQSDFTGQDVQSLPDRPSESGITASQLKAIFDRSAQEIIAKGKVNDILDLLTSTMGAANLGAALLTGAPDGSGATDTATAYLDGTVQGHIDATVNPHCVTKAQIGLGNVDNTSDMDKPVSTAQGTAIDAAKSEAKEYADTKDVTTLKAAKTYTDQAVISSGAADMQKAVYDPEHYETDIFGYTNSLAGGFVAGEVTGDGTEYEVSFPDLPNPIPAGVKLPTLIFAPNMENAQGATIRINSNTAAGLYVNGGPVSAGLLKAGVPVTALYDVLANKVHLVGTGAGGASTHYNILLLAANWTLDETSGEYRCPIAITGDTTDMMPVISPTDMAYGGMQGVNDNGDIYVRAQEPPDADLLVQLTLMKVREEG